MRDESKYPRSIGAIRVADDCFVTITVSDAITRQGLLRLKEYIDLITPWFPEAPVAGKDEHGN